MTVKDCDCGVRVRVAGGRDVTPVLWERSGWVRCYVWLLP